MILVDSSVWLANSRGSRARSPPEAARNYRALGNRGITIRKTVDIIIGTFCIERGCALRRDDRDFVPMETHIGLKVI